MPKVHFINLVLPQLAHPVLESLEGMPPVWIKHLLLAFNQGDISKFEQMKPHWETMGDLVAHEKQLRQKITLLCLMEVCKFYDWLFIFYIKISTQYLFSNLNLNNFFLKNMDIFF